MLKRFPSLSGGRIIFLVTVAIVGYFLLTFALSYVRGGQLNAQEERLTTEIADLQAKYDRLQALEEYLKSDEYIEAVAREQLGLVKSGEVAYVAISTQATPTPAPGAPRQDLWWETLIR